MSRVSCTGYWNRTICYLKCLLLLTLFSFLIIERGIGSGAFVPSPVYFSHT